MIDPDGILEKQAATKIQATGNNDHFG